MLQGTSLGRRRPRAHAREGDGAKLTSRPAPRLPSWPGIRPRARPPPLDTLHLHQPSGATRRFRGEVPHDLTPLARPRPGHRPTLTPRTTAPPKSPHPRHRPTLTPRTIAPPAPPRLRASPGDTVGPPPLRPPSRHSVPRRFPGMAPPPASPRPPRPRPSRRRAGLDRHSGAAAEVAAAGPHVGRLGLLVGAEGPVRSARGWRSRRRAWPVRGRPSVSAGRARREVLAGPARRGRGPARARAWR